MEKVHFKQGCYHYFKYSALHLKQMHAYEELLNPARHQKWNKNPCLFLINEDKKINSTDVHMDQWGSFHKPNVLVLAAFSLLPHQLLVLIMSYVVVSFNRQQYLAPIQGNSWKMPWFWSLSSRDRGQRCKYCFGRPHWGTSPGRLITAFHLH